mgnify:CR=1 FL=1
MELLEPQPLADHHQIGAFDSGVELLDQWLKQRAQSNQVNDASRVVVICDGDKAAGYYALAAGAVSTTIVPGFFRRNMPDPIPVAILGRLAIDRAYQRRGIGRLMLYDAARRIVSAAEIIGIRGMIVHAISEEAQAFYMTYGFTPSPVEPRKLMVTLADLRRANR